MLHLDEEHLDEERDAPPLAVGTAAPLAEPGRRRRLLRWVAISTSALTVLAAAVVVREVAVASGRTFGGYVSEANQLPLEFPTTGAVVQVLVHAGERVRKGQLLAVLGGSTAAASAVAADRAALAADQAQATELLGIAAAAQGAKVSATLTSAEQGLASAQSALQTATTQGSAAAATAQGAVQAANDKLAADRATEATACAGRAGAGCAAARAAIVSDADALAAAQAAAASARDESLTRYRQAQDAVSSAQAVLSRAEQTVAPASSPTLTADIDASHAAIARDQAALAHDQAALSATSLTAPTDGTVTAVGAQPGDIAGPDGVQAVSFAASGTSSPPTRSLVAAPSTPAAGVGGSGTVTTPAVTLSLGAPTEVVVAVPAARALYVERHREATVRVSAAGLSGVPATLADLPGGTYVVNGTLSFDAVYRVRFPSVPAVLPGMTVDVTVNG